MVSVEILHEENCPYRISTHFGTKSSLQNDFYPFSDVQYSSDLIFVPGPEMSLLCTLVLQIKTLSFTQDAMFSLSFVNLEMTFNSGTPCGLDTLKEIN